MPKALSLISKIREAGNALIIAKLKECGYESLVPSHGDILVVLYKYGKSTMKDIADKIYRSKATVTVLVDKLEKLGLVLREKSDEDSRITNIVLTGEGEALKPKFEEISDELNHMLYKDFSKEESMQLDLLLEKMLKNTR